MLTLTVFLVYAMDFSMGNETVDVFSATKIANSSAGLQCRPFEWFEHGEVSVSTANYNDQTLDVMHIECERGYDLFGPPKIICVNGEWEMTQKPKCSVRCAQPPYIANGDIEFDEETVDVGAYKKGTLATYSCHNGYVLSPPDSEYRVCEKGIWTGANGTCAPLERITKCRPVESIANGYVIHEKLEDPSSFFIGQSVQHACNTGYALEGDSVQTCLQDGSWAPKLTPVCVAKVDQLSTPHCSSAPTFPHTVSKVISGFPYMSSADADAEVEIYCLPRYRNINSPCEPARLRCIGGQWMGIPPNCVFVNECRCPPKVALGTPFIITPTAFETEKRCSYPINTSISYLCVPGYELEGCSIMTCGSGGCWEPPVPPICKIKQHYYYLETNGGEPIVFSLATGAGVLLLLVVACLIIVCRKRKPMSRSVAMPPPVPRPDLADHASLLHPPDRLALIAFADGMQVGQSGLPTYEEATRDRNLGITSSRLQRPPWPSLIGRRTRNSPNPDNILFTRQGSFASHSASTRSGGDPMGSTDTMAVSENSTTVTLDTASSHSGSQPASCRAHCGSLASFDTSSVLNTEGVPLLEESELEEIQCGETVSLAMENRSMCDNTSYKLSTASDLA